MGPESRTLNEHQQRRLWVTCKHIDDLLSDMEATLSEIGAGKAFRKFIPDLNPAQRRVIEDYIARLREQLARVLTGQGIHPPAPSIPASRSIYTALNFVDIGIEELKPKYMRGYGEVPDTLAVELNGIVGELQSLVSQFTRFLAQGAGEDLRDRLKRLEKESGGEDVLSSLEQIISKHGLVEFRPTLSLILDRMEGEGFEIALFGRVSSGKSSLLNGILQMDVLPIGVTPITTVPTRIAFGEDPTLTVWFAEKGKERYSIERLAEFVTEQQNPGNGKHVSRIMLQVPAAELRQGIVFVDTPGLGSLATAGAAETVAYLPRCDLGVVLVDAGSTITPDDIQTIQSLYQAGTPATVLISKADLLSKADLVRLIDYTRDKIQAELRLELNVYPVSSLPQQRQLLNRWLEGYVRPLYQDARQLRSQSIGRKIGALRQAVSAALEAQLRRSKRTVGSSDEGLVAVEAELRVATGRIAETATALQGITQELARSAIWLLDQVADTVSVELPNSDQVFDPGAVLSGLVQAKAAAVGKLLRELAQALTKSTAEAARRLELSEAPGENEFEGAVRELPVFEFYGKPAVHLPPLGGLMGRKYVKSRLRSRLQSEIGKTLESALATYAMLLQDWAERVLRSIQQQFELHAASYRAQLGRSLSGGQSSAESAVELERDLMRLRMEVHETVSVQTR